MTDQLRYNTGKPKLTYIFSAHVAFDKVSEYATTDLTSEVEPFSEVLRDLADFLGRADDLSLVDALFGCVRHLDRQLGGLSTEPKEWMNATFFFVSHVKAFEEFCKVCEYGERKYNRGNYRKGAPISQYLDCALRHGVAFVNGTALDKESGCHHLAHMFWNLWMALDMPEHRDDRLPAVARPVVESPIVVDICDEPC